VNIHRSSVPFFVIILFLFTFSTQMYAAPAGDPFQVSTTTWVGGGRSVIASMGGNGDSIVLIYDVNVAGTFMQRYDRSGFALETSELYLGQGNMVAGHGWPRQFCGRKKCQ